MAGCTPAAAWQPPATSFQLAAVEDRGAAAPVTAFQPAGSASSGPADSHGSNPGPSAAPSAPPRSGGGSSGGGSAAAPVVPEIDQVLDRQGNPVAGATLLFADGASFQTGADGRYTPTGTLGGLPFTVFASGYASTMVAAGARPGTIHLERLPSADQPFEGDEIYLRGSVTWLGVPPQGGTVQYRDALGSLCNPVVVNDDGFFTLRVVTTRSGRPTGRIMALAAGADGHPMMGLSAPFSLRDQGAEPVSVAVVKASQEVSFQVGAPPAELTEITNHLEIIADGIAPFQMQGPGTTSGTYKVPAKGALGATVRLVATAADAERVKRSVVTLDPYALPAAPPQFLAVPTVAVDAPGRRISWGAPAGSRGVRLGIAQAPNLAEEAWEGWFESATGHTFEAADWPTGASATARVTAFVGSDITARRVASARQLRLLPGDWPGGFRWSEARATFTP